MAQVANRVLESGSAYSVDPMVAEVVHHLMSARVSLERIAVSRESTSYGREFPQFEVSARAIHMALIALRGCALPD